MERPVGIAEHFAGEEDEIGLAVGDDCVGLLRIGDHADGGGGDGGFGADARGEGNLVAGADGDFCVGNEAAGGDVDEVDAVGAEMAGESDGVVDGPAAFGPVGGRDADEEGQVFGPGCADGCRPPRAGGGCGFRSCRRRRRCAGWRAGERNSWSR